MVHVTVQSFKPRYILASAPADDPFEAADVAESMLHTYAASESLEVRQRALKWFKLNGCCSCGDIGLSSNEIRPF